MKKKTILVAAIAVMLVAALVDGASGGAQPAYTVSSGAMVHQLNVWMDHFRKLPAAQRLTGQDAIDYLTRCMRLL